MEGLEWLIKSTPWEGRHKIRVEKTKNWEAKILEILSVDVVLSKIYFGSHVDKSYT